MLEQKGYGLIGARIFFCFQRKRMHLYFLTTLVKLSQFSSVINRKSKTYCLTHFFCIFKRKWVLMKAETSTLSIECLVVGGNPFLVSEVPALAWMSYVWSDKKSYKICSFIHVSKSKKKKRMPLFAVTRKREKNCGCQKRALS